VEKQGTNTRVEQQAEEAGQRVLRTATWLLVAVLATVAIGFCAVVLYLMSA
jgi:hypothetical protein